MLYTIIKYVSASIFLIIGRHSTNGGYIEPNITIDQDIDCGDAYNDTCIINCALNFDEANWTTARIPHVYCGNTTKCVIHCSANYCLRDSYIHANHTTHLDILSHGGNGCFQSSQLYLPNHGNATIIGHTNRVTNHTLNDLQIYSGTHTNRIGIQCHDSIHSNTQNDCDSLQIHAQTAQYLSITVNESSFSNSTIHCPQSSPLSPSCIINADDAQSTEHVHIYAPKGTPQDVIFHSNGDGVYTGTTITCLDGNYSSIIRNTSFIGTPCFITTTTAPTTNPTMEPTLHDMDTTLHDMDTTLHDMDTTLIEIDTTRNEENQGTPPPKGIEKLILRLLQLDMLLFILCGLTLLACCCIIALYCANKKKQQQIEKHQSLQLHKQSDDYFQAGVHDFIDGHESPPKEKGKQASHGQPMENIIAELRLNKIGNSKASNVNDVVEYTDDPRSTPAAPPVQANVEVEHVTRLPPPKRRVKSNEQNQLKSSISTSMEKEQSIERKRDEEDEESSTEEKSQITVDVQVEVQIETQQIMEAVDSEDSDSSDSEGVDDDVVNIVCSSPRTELKNAERLQRVRVQSQSDPLEEMSEGSDESEPSSSKKNETKGNTKGATKGDISDSDSSFSSEDAQGGITDIGDLVIGHGGVNDGEADDEDLLVGGEVGSF
eukprot:68197_1